MPEYLSPGVYVEELDAGAKPIEGVSTSTAGAVGVTERGPTDGRPWLVTSFAQFQRIFGGLLPEPDAEIKARWQTAKDTDGNCGTFWRFPLAVKGFFDNGGQRIFIKRVVSSKATAAKTKPALGQGLYLDLAKGAKKGEKILKLDPNSKLVGISKGTQLMLVRTDGGIPQGPFTVASSKEDATEVELTDALIDDVLPGSWVVGVQDGTASVYAATPSLTFSAYALGAWGNAIQVRLRPMVSATFSLLPSSGESGLPPVTTSLSAKTDAGTGTIAVTSAAGFSNNDKVLINGTVYTLSDAKPATPGDPAATPAVPAADATFTISPNATEPLKPNTQVRRLLGAVDPEKEKFINLSNPSRVYEGALLELDGGGATKKVLRKVVSRVGNKVELDGDLPPNTFYDVSTARLIEARVEVRYQPDPNQPETLERFENLRLTDDGSPSYLVTRVNQGSALVRVEATKAWVDAKPGLFTFPAVKDGGWASLQDGDDQLSTLSPDDFVGKDGGPDKRTGIQALEDIDEISLCMVPGIWAKSVRGALILHCESLKDRFAIVDPPPATLLDEGRRLDPETIKGPVDTKYAAIYYPWLIGRDFVAQRDVLLPPSGHLAGIYARTDVERGVHKAPANEVVRGIDRFELNITRREQDMLNPKGVNALRFFPERGFRVWGARTMTSDASWKYINVRRLFIFVEESIDEGTQWVVFEPNDEKLWARVRATIEQFLDRLWREGMLQGETRNQAYFVKCDSTTMTQDEIDTGKLICVIGIAPVKPAEFVIFRIQQKTLDQKA